MHKTLIDKIVAMAQNYQGTDGDVKLKKMLSGLDVSVYQQKNYNENVLVSTEMLQEEMKKIK